MRQLYLSVFALTLFFSTSCLEQGKLPKVPGINGPNLNVQDGRIKLSVGFERIRLPGGATLPIPKMDNSTVTFGVDLNGGSFIKVDFDPKDLEGDDLKFPPPEKLPDGRDFPFKIEGTLPVIAVNLPRVLDMTLYMGDSYFGFFIPINLPPKLDFKTDVSIDLVINGKSLGAIAWMSKRSSQDISGLVLMLSKKKIDRNGDLIKLLEFSKKHKSEVF